MCTPPVDPHVMSDTPDPEFVRMEINHRLADSVDVFGVETDEIADFTAFMKAALGQAHAMIGDNRTDAVQMMDVEKTVDNVLSPENVRDVDWEADRFTGKRVTVWLRDCPTWANDADTREFYVDGGLNKRNGKVSAVIDVRPF